MTSGGIGGDEGRASSSASGNVTPVSTEQVALPRPLVTGVDATKPRGVEPVVTKPPMMIRDGEAPRLLVHGAALIVSRARMIGAIDMSGFAIRSPTSSTPSDVIRRRRMRVEEMKLASVR